MKFLPRIYFASKLSHAPLVLALRNTHPEIHFTQRWDLMAGQIEDSPAGAPKFWQDDYDDIWRSDAVLIWGKPEDKLRGALVEAGIAIGMKKLVIAAGEHPDFGTWQYHPRVWRKFDLEAGLIAAAGISPFPR